MLSSTCIDTSSSCAGLQASKKGDTQPHTIICCVPMCKKGALGLAQGTGQVLKRACKQGTL